MITSYRTPLALLLALVATLGLSGCADDSADKKAEETITPNAVIFDQTTQAIMMPFDGINGEYSGCKNRSGKWSIGTMPNPPIPLPYPPLSVVKNDTNCTLIFLSFRTSPGFELLAYPAFPLSTSFQAQGSRVDYTSTMPPSQMDTFYANARLSAAGYAGDFTILVKYSNDPYLASAAVTAHTSSITASADLQGVPAPDYIVDASNLSVEADGATAQGATGYVQLTMNSVAGQTWVAGPVYDANVFPGPFSPSNNYRTVDDIYTLGTPQPMPVDGRIPASAFPLAGAPLPSWLTLFVANTQDGVRSYEGIYIQINPPQLAVASTVADARALPGPPERPATPPARAVVVAMRLASKGLVMSRSTRRSLTFALFVALGLAGCGNGADEQGNQETVTPQAILLGQASQAWLAGGQRLQFVNGVYGGCKSRSGSWSIAVQPGASAPYPALSVLKNDKHCSLTLTSITTSAYDDYGATPAILLGTAFKSQASRFENASASPGLFYANARLSAADFASDFKVFVAYSPEEKVVSGNTGVYTFSAASADLQSVPAPDYSVDASHLYAEADTNGVVQQASGHVQLNPGTTAGQTWVVGQASAPPSTYADIDRLYLESTPRPMPADGRIPASEFDLVGVTLPTTGFLCIANTQDGVRAYEVVFVFLNPA